MLLQGTSLHCTALDCAGGVPSPPVPVQTWIIVACRMVRVAVVLLTPHRSVRYGRFPGGSARGELRMLIPTRGMVREQRTTPPPPWRAQAAHLPAPACNTPASC